MHPTYISREEADSSFDESNSNLWFKDASILVARTIPKKDVDEAFEKHKKEIKSFLNTTRQNDLNAIRELMKATSGTVTILEGEKYVKLSDILSLLDNLEKTLK